MPRPSNITVGDSHRKGAEVRRQWAERAEQKPAASYPIEQYGGFKPRVVAIAVDGAAAVLAALALGAVAGWLAPVGAALYVAAMAALTGLKGWTPGKRAVGLRVVNEQGDPPGLKAGFIREFAGRIASTLPLGAGYSPIYFDEYRRCWHDKMAGTWVVREGAVAK